MDKEIGLFQEYFGLGGGIQKFFCPGRANLIGEHIDYNGGLGFPAALTIGITAWVRKSNNHIVRMRSLNMSGEVKINLDIPVKYNAKDGWGNYPKGLLYYISIDNKVPGCDILFSSNLPDGSGLSSSAAIEVLSAYIFYHLSGKTDISKKQIAILSQKSENEFIKLNCGIMDQFAVAMGKKDHAILLNCANLDYQHVPFELGSYSLVIMNTNKSRELADSKYNERRSECDSALEEIKKKRKISTLCEADLEEVNELNNLILKKRARHEVSENQRVKEAVKVLKEGNVKAFGQLLTASHKSLRDDYEVSGKELDAIVEEALNTEGCMGARMTGAGFGGCAIAIVEKSKVDSFKLNVAGSYFVKCGRKASFYESGIGDGVRELF